MDSAVTTITWRMDARGGARPRVKWSVPSTDCASLIGALATLLANGTDQTQDEVAVKRAHAAVKSKHALRLRLHDNDALNAELASARAARAGAGATAAAPNDDDIDAAEYAAEAAESGSGAALPARHVCVRVAVRTSRERVLWENPLVSAQRSEGLVLIHAPGAAGGNGSGDCYVWRVSPIDAQLFIAAALAVATAEGSNARPLPLPLQPPAATASSSTSASSAADVAADSAEAAASALSPAAASLYASAAAEARAWAAASSALATQRDRVVAGGEEWTRMEKLAKRSKLQTLVMSVYARAEVAPGCGCEHDHGGGHGDHGHGGDHHHGGDHAASVLAQAMAPRYDLSKLSEYDRSILEAYAQAQADME